MIQIKTPYGWNRKKLSEIARIDRKNIKPESIKPGTFYIGLEHINKDGSFGDFQAINPGELSSNKFYFEKNHILYGKLRPYLKKIARPEISGICSTDIIPILPTLDIDRDFLFYYLRQPKCIDLATVRSSGANLPRISPKTLGDFPIVFPPIAEQKRIAAILDKADAVRRKRREAIRLTEELLRSVFLDMFGVQHEYPVLPLGDLCSVKGGKRLPKGEPLVTENTGFPYIRAGNLKNGTVTGEICFITKSVREKIKRYTISSKDVYITIVGAYIGDVGIIPDYLDGANLTENAAKLVLKSQKITNTFLSNFLRSDLGQKQIKSKIKATGQPKFALFRIEELLIPTAPITKQERFESVAQSIKNKLRAEKSSYQESEDLFNSLLQRAFTGNL